MQHSIKKFNVSSSFRASSQKFDQMFYAQNVGIPFYGRNGKTSFSSSQSFHRMEEHKFWCQTKGFGASFQAEWNCKKRKGGQRLDRTQLWPKLCCLRQSENCFLFAFSLKLVQWLWKDGTTFCWVRHLHHHGDLNCQLTVLRFQVSRLEALPPKCRWRKVKLPVKRFFYVVMSVRCPVIVKIGHKGNMLEHLFAENMRNIIVVVCHCDPN